jgi:hypothetical protein
MDRRKVMRDRPKAKSSDTKIHFPGRSVLAALPVFEYFYLLLILPFIGSGDGGP